MIALPGAHGTLDDAQVFQNLASADGKPHDARVLELLLDDKADARMQRAAVSVYTEGAVAEWGDAVLDASQAVPHLAASFGIMANIMTKVLPQQVWPRVALLPRRGRRAARAAHDAQLSER